VKSAITQSKPKWIVGEGSAEKQTQEEFITKSRIIFGNTLDYSKVVYVNSWTEIILTCPKHGDFTIAPKDHLSYKRGCKICSGFMYNTQSFIDKAVSIHGETYLYDNVMFVSVKAPILITCKIHGDFEQRPDKHINGGQGCPRCKKSARKDLDYFITMGNKIHNNFYDYSLVEFTRMFDKISIICPLHGIFRQLPANHINHKQRCPKCIVGKSKKEKLWLDAIGLPDDNIHRTVIIKLGKKKFIVDGFDPKTNTVYEFYGDFWHGNPKVYAGKDINDALNTSFESLYSKTLKRESLLKKNGFKVEAVWEYDFDETNNIPHYKNQRKK
jgi:hypothetical protein